MPDPYATYGQFTAVYSLKGISQEEISSHWLFYGSSRVDESIGDVFSTPFSSNNQTARELCIDFAMVGLLTKTRNQEDSRELREVLKERVAVIRSSGLMRTDAGSTIRADGGGLTVYANTENFKNTFDFRDALYQRVDPDRIGDDWDRDT